MVNNIRLIVFGAFLSVLITACTDDTFSGTDSVRTEGSARICLTITIPDAEIVQTRAGVSGDASVEKLNVLLFDNSQGDTDETGIGLVAQRSIDDITTNTSIELPLSTDSRMVYVVANARSYLSDILAKQDGELKNSDGTYKYSLAQVRTMLTTTLSSSPDGDGFITGADIPGIPVPMSALVRFNDGLASNAIINAQMVRMLSRISVSTSLSTTKFKIKGLTVCNGAQTGSVLAPAIIGNDGKGLGRMAYTAPTDTVLYAYPTAVGGSDEPVSVVVEAQYNGQTVSSFYRLLITDDCSDPDKGLSLGRNHHYLIKINRVDMEGQSDLAAAISASPANIDYSVEESNDFSSVTIVNGNMFSIDTERLVIYADSLPPTPLVLFRTNYLLAAGEQIGSIEVDEGLILLGNPFFTQGDTVRNLIVEVTPSYMYDEHSGSDSKGIHLTLGGYTATIEIVKRASVDVHPVVIELDGISNARFLSSSGDADLWWTSFSLSPVYSPYSRTSSLSAPLLQQSGDRGYLHLDENMNNSYREAYLETVSLSGKRTKIVLRQEGVEHYLLGFFGGTLQTTGDIYQYSKQLVIEGYEESEEKLTLLTSVPTETQKSQLHALLTDGRQSTIVLARDYNSQAALYCLNKNRDTNGNGQIDDDEVLWYLPGVAQGMGIALYQSLSTGMKEQYWSSSCQYVTFDEGWGSGGVHSVHNEGVWALNTIYNSTGYDMFVHSFAFAVSQKRSVRCVRDF